MIPGGVLKGEDAGLCPFCRGKIAVSSEPPAVMHSLPLCAEYRALPPLEFLERVSAADRTRDL